MSHSKTLTPEEVVATRTSDIADGIRAWFRVQELVELEGMPEALEPTNDNIRTYTLALLEEVHEYARELNWRPWHQHKPVDKLRALKEYADIMAFMGLLGYYLTQLTDATPDEIAQVYKNVSIDNMKLLLSKRNLPPKG